MRAEPSGIATNDLAQALADNWNVGARTLKYQPVGGGSYHWIAGGPSGPSGPSGASRTRHFITVDDLATKPWLGDTADAAYTGIERAFATAHLLHDAGLDFVVAPIRARNHDVVVRLDRRYSLAVFPLVEGIPGTFGETVGEGERAALCTMWATLHLATPAVRSTALERTLAIPGRPALEHAMRQAPSRPWSGGAHSEEAREWLATNERIIRLALTTFDRLARQVHRARRQLVITHGEPHGGNIIRNGADHHLVDWDTVALALPERDLWMLDDGTTHAFDSYVDATGWPVDRDALDLYRLTWLLSDAAAFVSRLKQDHADDADSRHAWAALQATGTELDRFNRARP